MSHASKAATLGLLAVGIILGCGPKASPRPSAANPSAQIPIDSNASPAAVVLNVDEGQLSPERRAAFEQLNGPTRLVAAVREEMARQQRVPACTVQLALTVTDFRIRPLRRACGLARWREPTSSTSRPLRRRTTRR